MEEVGRHECMHECRSTVGCLHLTTSTLPVGDDMDYGNDSFGYDELCAMFDESSQCTIVLPEEGLGYGLVVPFPAYAVRRFGFANENLNSPKQQEVNQQQLMRRASLGESHWTTRGMGLDPLIEENFLFPL